MADGVTDTADDFTDDAEEHPGRISGWWLLPISGLLWWVAGFLPWLLHELYQAVGLEPDSLEEIDGFTPLPLAAPDAVAVLVTLSVIGGALAGGSTRLARYRASGAVAAVFGTLFALAGVGAVAWWQVYSAEGADDAKANALLAVTAGGTLLGLLLGLLAALAPAPLRAAAFALPVVLADGWVWGLLPGNSAVPQGTWWIFAIVLGIALGLGVDRNPLQMLGWLPAAGLVWVLQAARPVFDAVGGYFVPGAAPLSVPAVLDAAWRPLRETTFSVEGHDLGGWVVGLLIGVAVAGLRLTWAARNEEDDDAFDALRGEFAR